MITGPISFGSSDISISDNTIDLSGEQIEQGEKVVYISNQSSRWTF